MKLEEQVCTLEQAKRLKELGVKQDSFWYWGKGFFYKGEYNQRLFAINELRKYYPGEAIQEGFTSAFTVAELGELYRQKMPNHFITVAYYFDIDKDCNDGIVINGEMSVQYRGKTEAEARANLLIHILEVNNGT